MFILPHTGIMIQNKEEIRAQAAISVLNGLLETTKHSVVESIGICDIYAKVAVLYADALIEALDAPKIDIRDLLKDIENRIHS